MFFLFLLFVVIPIIAIIVIVTALSNGPGKQPTQMRSYERPPRYYDDWDDDFDDDLDDDFADDRESDAYSEGYQQGRLDSQRNGQVKNEKAESESFWKPHSDYLDEYDYWMQVIFGQRKLRLIAERVELKIFLIQKN